MSVIAVASAQVVAWGWRQASDNLAAVVQESLRREQQELFEFDELYDELRRNGALHESLRNAFLVKSLRNNQQKLRRLLDSYGQDANMQLPLAEVQYRLGNVCRDLREIGSAEQAFRAARELLFQSGAPRDRAFEVTYGINSSRLCCLLASLGRWQEAEEFGIEAVEALSRQGGLGERGSYIDLELAVACRNLALVRTALGQDGRQDARYGVEASLWIEPAKINADTAKQWIVSRDLWLDGCQLLSAMLWQAGDLTAAEELCLQTVHRLNELIEYMQYRDGQQMSWPRERYHKARQLAEHNLAAVRQQRREGRTSTPAGPASRLPAAWRWHSLYWIQGEVVDHSLLTPVRLAAEFESHEALLLNWLNEEWARPTVLAMAQAIWPRIRLVILAKSSRLAKEARAALREAGIPDHAYELIHAPTDSLWLRDYGPQLVETSGGALQCVDTYYGFDRFTDDAIPSTISKNFQIPMRRIPLDVEGGAFVTNGAGLCLASTKILDVNAGQGLTEPQVTDLLKQLTGAEQIVYLQPLQNESTGHVDVFATFTSANTVVVGDFDSADPANGQRLDRHAERLAGLSTTAGPLKVVRIPMPPSSLDSVRGSYTNVVFANGVLLVPSSRESPPELESEVVAVYERLLPDWQIVKLPSDSLWDMHGGPRCATMHLYRLSEASDAPPAHHTASRSDR